MEITMKKGTLILILLTISLLWAEKQTFQIIEKTANHFIQNKMGQFTVTEKYPVQANEEIYAYVFNLEPNGFIAVSSDSQLPPVIAYSIHNNLFEDDKHENLYYQMFAQDMQKRLEFYRLNPNEAQENQELWYRYLNHDFSERNFQQWPPAGTTLTDGWVETTWQQSGVFNQFCPLDNSGQRSVVGCVATAMAMIIDYHRHVGNVFFTDADDYYSGYSYPYIHIDNHYLQNDFPNFPQLNVYLNDVKNRYLNNQVLTGTDKAALSFACGIATEMSYSSNGSGTWTELVAGALLNKFGYSSAQYIDNNGSSFYNSLKQNMKIMQPAEMSIYTSGWNNGHAIICDGYNTNNYYHLNYGWGTSNASCWYLLPSGMPDNYSIIGGAVVNIQGGQSPIAVQGQVSVVGVSPVGTYIRLEGEHVSEVFVTNANGNFSIPAIWPGFYTVIAYLDDRFYYQSFEVEINTNNQFIQINLDEFDQVTGVVSAPITAENCKVVFYQNNEIVYQGITDATGIYSIPEVYPGIYTATASLANSYFQMQEIEITADNQTANFELEEYPGTISFAYSSYPAGMFTFLANYVISFAVKITQAEWSELASDVLANVRFKSPINYGEGELFAQIWQDNTLLEEKQISDFMLGEWIECQFDSFIPQTGLSYFAGYKIMSHTGNFAYYDNTPKVTGKGSFMRISAWSEISNVLLQNNLCIEVEFLTKSYGTVTGNIVLHGNTENISDVAIKTGNYIAHPDENGAFSLQLKPGTYEISVFSEGFEPAESQLFVIAENDFFDNVVFELFSTDSFETNIPIPFVLTLGNFPNPFNPSTTIVYSIPESEHVELTVFNVKGQKVKTLIKEQKNAGTHSIQWDGSDEQGNPVSSGIYLYRLQNNAKNLVRKMLLSK
jgi:hypothetical protein